MNFSKLISTYDNVYIKEDFKVTNIAYNTNDVQSGSVFVALVGTKTDGHIYIEKAIEKGAKAIVISDDLYLRNIKCSYVFVDNTRKELSNISKIFYDCKDIDINIIGITGTNGKTTVTNMLSDSLNSLSSKTEIIGTLGITNNSEVITTDNTTPESTIIHRTIGEFKKNGVKNVAIEVSSHALDTYRVSDLDINYAAFTNLTQDHLDFHNDMKAYYESKKRLFEEFE